ncbi:hypothetical protein H0H92_015311 [Tricholoma furcatifolium]|nr:hypothetical protein H0H92_015311 [Tricholoma furcatifolium]
MHLQESVFCATAASSSSAGLGSISVHDIQTGTTLASFKQTNAAPHCTAFIETRNAQGGFILAAQPEKSILNVYNFQKDQINLKIVLPEKLTCIAIDPKGTYCAGGTAQGRIYFWEIASGILYHSWDAHYRQVTVLRFTLDSAALISGSEDSGLWDLSSQSLLTTFQYPKPISSLAWDLTERIFMAASPDGSIHQTNLFRQRDTKKGGQFTEAIGGAGVTDIIRVGEEGREATRRRLISVGQPVTAMCISLTSSHLLVGTDAGLIYIYDIPSHQLLRTITTHKGFAITHLATMLKPPDLIGHINLSLSVGSAADAKDVIPVKPVAPFQRMRDPKAREAHDLSLLLPPQKTRRQDVSTYELNELLHDHAFFVQPAHHTSAPGTDSFTLKTKVEDLEAEVARLREQLGRAKTVNNVMWDTVVHRTLRQNAPAESEEPLDDERRRKRGRT